MNTHVYMLKFMYMRYDASTKPTPEKSCGGGRAASATQTTNDDRMPMISQSPLYHLVA